MLRGRAIPLLLAAATLIPIGALGWLGARVIQQDREVGRQRQREDLELAAGRLAIGIDRRLNDIEEQLARGSGIHLTPEGPQGSGLLYTAIEERSEDVSALFAGVDVLEFQRADFPSALAQLRKLAASPKAAVRAAALNRIGRVERKAGHTAQALAAYDNLLRMRTAAVEGQPAALLARQARCQVFEQTGDKAALKREAGEFANAVYGGGWSIDQPTFDVYKELIERWGAGPPSQDAMDLTEAAIALWRIWRSGDLPLRGRRVLRVGAAPVLAVWMGADEGPAVWLASRADIESTFGSLWHAAQLAVSISDPDGLPVIGTQQPGAVDLNPGQTRLPFVLSVAGAPARAAADDYARKEAYLIIGLLLIFTLAIASAYGLYRVTSREMELGRQQSDFVSAVSHEFRTPLTSMRHLTELLAMGSIVAESKKVQYYGLLSRETERLHRMVESLLSFGRIEAGAHAWHLETVEAGKLLPEVLEEFSHEPEATGRELLCDIEENLPAIRADRVALSRALRNLLENAGKYSDPPSSIRVFAQRSNGSLLMGVEDHGIGIAPHEQSRIFQKFVRGAEVRRAGIRGVGIGLALVERIAKAHGGTVKLRSELGRGSTFTLVLPCRES